MRTWWCHSLITHSPLHSRRHKYIYSIASSCSCRTSHHSSQHWLLDTVSTQHTENSLKDTCTILRSLRRTLFYSAVCIYSSSDIDTASLTRVTKYVFTTKMANIRLYSTVGHSRIIEKLQTSGNYFNSNNSNLILVIEVCFKLDEEIAEMLSFSEDLRDVDMNIQHAARNWLMESLQRGNCRRPERA